MFSLPVRHVLPKDTENVLLDSMLNGQVDLKGISDTVVDGVQVWHL